MHRNIINLVMFQIGWFACVFAAANRFAWAGTLTVAVLASIHLYYVTNRRQEVWLLLSAGLLGYLWESSLAGISLITYPGYENSLLAPIWMAALWINFAITLNFSLAWFKRHLILASIAGLLFAPMAYYAGVQIGAIAFSHQWIALGIIGIGWSILFPFLAWLAQCLTEKNRPIDRDIPRTQRHV